MIAYFILYCKTEYFSDIYLKYYIILYTLENDKNNSTVCNFFLINFVLKLHPIRKLNNNKYCKIVKMIQGNECLSSKVPPCIYIIIINSIGRILSQNRPYFMHR